MQYNIPKSIKLIILSAHLAMRLLLNESEQNIPINLNYTLALWKTEHREKKNIKLWADFPDSEQVALDVVVDDWRRRHDAASPSWSEIPPLWLSYGLKHGSYLYKCSTLLSTSDRREENPNCKKGGKLRTGKRGTVLKWRNVRPAAIIKVRVES